MDYIVNWIGATLKCESQIVACIQDHMVCPSAITP